MGALSWPIWVWGRTQEVAEPPAQTHTDPHEVKSHKSDRGQTQPKSYEVVACGNADDLLPYLSSWQALGPRALTPNIFYESWMLLPALRLYGHPAVQVVLVLEHDPNLADKTRLIGVFPLEFCRSFHGLPLASVRMWKHPHCYLATPLLAPGTQDQCWQAIFAWLRDNPDAGRLWEMQTILGDGPVLHSLQDFNCQCQTPVYTREVYMRALLVLAESGEQYLKASMKGDHRRSYARKKRQLAEKGKLEVLHLQPEDDLDSWLEAFLQLESSGWKGHSATAMACRQIDRDYFVQISREAYARDRLMMTLLKLDGKTIAAHHGILAGAGAFALKIAYDETLGAYSPGILLEIELLNTLHEQRPCQWVDCCSAAGNLAMCRVWKQQRPIASVVCPTGKRGSSLLVSLLPLLRYSRHWLRRILHLQSAVEQP